MISAGDWKRWRRIQCLQILREASEPTSPLMEYCDQEAELLNLRSSFIHTGRWYGHSRQQVRIWTAASSREEHSPRSTSSSFCPPPHFTGSVLHFLCWSPGITRVAAQKHLHASRYSSETLGHHNALYSATWCCSPPIPGGRLRTQHLLVSWRSIPQNYNTLAQ